MNLRTNFNKGTIFLILFFIAYMVQSQEAPVIKYFDENTVDAIKIDYDNDGDLDYIIAGVNGARRQGRVYLVENNEDKLGKPTYIYSFPTIPIKQQLDIQQKDNITTINIFGTSPTGEQTKYVGTLFKGAFVGMLLPPATSNPEN